MRVVPEDKDLVMQMVAEARQLSIAAPIVLPMLERRKHGAYQRMLAAYRAGKGADINAMAEMSVIEAIQSEIREKLENLNLVQE